MFAVLGNHDYGDYGNLNDADKKESIAKIQEMQSEIEFQTLNNPNENYSNAQKFKVSFIFNLSF